MEGGARHARFQIPVVGPVHHAGRNGLIGQPAEEVYFPVLQIFRRIDPARAGQGAGFLHQVVHHRKREQRRAGHAVVEGLDDVAARAAVWAAGKDAGARHDVGVGHKKLAGHKSARRESRNGALRKVDVVPVQGSPHRPEIIGRRNGSRKP